LVGTDNLTSLGVTGNITTCAVPQRTSHGQQTGAEDREETEGGYDTGRGREETCRPVQRAGKKLNVTMTAPARSATFSRKETDNKWSIK